MFMFILPYSSLTCTLGRMSLEVFMSKLPYGSLTCTLSIMSLEVFMLKLPYGSLTCTLSRMSLEVFMFILPYGSLTCALSRISLDAKAHTGLRICTDRTKPVFLIHTTIIVILGFINLRVRNHIKILVPAHSFLYRIFTSLGL